MRNTMQTLIRLRWAWQAGHVKVGVARWAWQDRHGKVGVARWAWQGGAERD
jgi:hypothetical protein